MAGIGAADYAWADPFLWIGTAAVFAGLAAGQALRAFAPAGPGRIHAFRLRSRRIARAIAFLSFGILAVAALFVLADKGGLAGAWASGPARLGLLAWSALALAFGIGAGSRPLLLGLPLAGLGLVALGLVRFGLQGWLPIRSDAGAASDVEVARLLPYEVGPASFHGQLELPRRDSLPVVQEVGLASSSIGLCVESLELRGPLRLAACILLPDARSFATAYSPTQRLYRVVGLVAPGGLASGLAFPAPRYIRLLDAALPLPASVGLEPAGPTARATAFFGLAQRARRTSAEKPLAVLEPLVFGLGGADLAITVRAGR
jgi:hypothetical protein